MVHRMVHCMVHRMVHCMVHMHTRTHTHAPIHMRCVLVDVHATARSVRSNVRLRHRNAHMRIIRQQPFSAKPREKAMMLAKHCGELCYVFSDYDFARSCHARFSR